MGVLGFVAMAQDPKPASLEIPQESKKDLTILQLQAEIIRLKQEEVNRNIRELLAAILRKQGVPEEQFDSYSFDPATSKFIKK